MNTSDLLSTLRERDLLAAHSEGLAERAKRGPIAGYIGFDPTAISLHVGHLTSIRMLAHLAASGGQAFAVLGGATGLVGDPSGKLGARAMLDDATLEVNKAAVGAQLTRLLGPEVKILDNRDWLGSFGLLDFLRDIGRHFSVGEMLARDSVAARLAGTGMSFTEFGYSLLQAADFLELARRHHVELQMGGSDQWGNITAGTELIRRVLGRAPDGSPRAFGAVAPLLLDSNGRKMGKTEAGAIFLDPERTSPFAFFQFWLNSEDALVRGFLRRLTDVALEEIIAFERANAADPGQRIAARALAFSLTSWVHGRAIAERQRLVALAAFSSAPITDLGILTELHAQAGGFTFTVAELAAGPLAIAVASGLASSRNDARRLVESGGLTIGRAKISAPDAPLELVAERWIVVRVGRRRLAVGRLAG